MVKSFTTLYNRNILGVIKTKRNGPKLDDVMEDDDFIPELN